MVLSALAAAYENKNSVFYSLEQEAMKGILPTHAVSLPKEKLLRTNIETFNENRGKCNQFFGFISTNVTKTKQKLQVQMLTSVDQ